MKERIINVFKNLKEIFTQSNFYFFSILFLECLFTLVISKDTSIQWLINVLLSTVILSQFFTFFMGLFDKKYHKTVAIIILSILGILFSIQGVFYKIFKVYFSLYNVSLQDQLKAFMKDAINLIIKNSGYIILFMLPLIIYLINSNKINFKEITGKKISNYVISILFWIGIFISHIYIVNNNTYSTYDLYHNVNNTNLNIKRLGVLNSYGLESHRIMFGYTPKMQKNNNLKKEINQKGQNNDIEENKLDLIFKDIDDVTINNLNDYVKNVDATKKNKYTGMFKDYNLIYITAESFSSLGISKKLTPTLYKLTHNGFVFDNFYTPNNLSTIGGEFQSMTGLYPDSAILRRWRDGTNYFPYGLGNTFKSIGYNTYAYHDNSYLFQDRNQYIASQGFDNFLACYNGLEKRMNCNRWPQSDDEMIEVTVNDYLNSDKPFLAYYMTVSGHFEYSFSDNAIAYKNKDEVSDLSVGEHAKAYVATQIELDRALERLIKELKKSGKLDKTVIVLLADHYPYELDDTAINELGGNNDNIEINHTSLILWNNKLKKQKVEKPAMSTDVIPTIYNLFGIEYDSRLFSGRDILSDSLGLAILSDRSWVSEKGTYYSSNGKFSNEIDSDYISNINNIVNNRLNFSRLVLENDYYRYLFD